MIPLGRVGRIPLLTAICTVLVICPLSAQSRKKEKLQPQLPQVKKIDEFITQVWNDYELRPSKAATDGEWCRRVYLDVIGRIPTVEELLEFLVTVVDAELFEAVHLEILCKTK